MSLYHQPIRQSLRAQKQNQPKALNKKADLMTHLNNIKLPSYPLNNTLSRKTSQILHRNNAIKERHPLGLKQIDHNVQNGLKFRLNRVSTLNQNTFNKSSQLSNYVSVPIKNSLKQSLKQNSQNMMPLSSRMLQSQNYANKYPISSGNMGSSLNFNGNHNMNKSFNPIKSINTQLTSSIIFEDKKYNNKNNQQNKSKISQTEAYCQLYPCKLDQQQQQCCDFLNGHQIDAKLRGRMVDWMVEVTSSYNFSHSTYFGSVQILDKYFKNCSLNGQSIPASQLHIIGIVSMFIGSKFDQIYPLKLQTIYQKIAHKKISKQDILQCQNKMLESFGYQPLDGKHSLYNQLMYNISSILTQTDNYTEELMNQIQQICNVLCKYMCHCYNVITKFQKTTLVKYFTKLILSNFDIRFNQMMNDQQRQLSKQLQLDIQYDIAQFKKKFRGIGNISKFCDKGVVFKVDGLLGTI